MRESSLISDVLGLPTQERPTHGICSFEAAAALTATQIFAGVAAAASVVSAATSILGGPDKPSAPAVPTTPTEANTAAITAAAQEKSKDRLRARQKNVLTSPLGVLQQPSLQVKSLLGGGI